MADIMRESPLWHVIVNWPRALLNVPSRLLLMPMATYSIGELSSREETAATSVFDCAAPSKEKKIIRGNKNPIISRLNFIGNTFLSFDISLAYPSQKRRLQVGSLTLQ